MEFKISNRCLMGPGPSNVHPRVLDSLRHPPIGHLDPQFLDLMNNIQRMLRYSFKTENLLTIPISGTGSAAMEAAVCNFIEQGDDVLICVNGYFGDRLSEMALRYGAKIRKLERPWGEIFTIDEIKRSLEERPVKVVMIIHGETSTGALQPLNEIAKIVHDYGALLLVDCVTSLGGVPVEIDQWGIDIAYSATQKCLSVPPGLSPITVGPRAIEILDKRKTPVPNWYLDLTMVRKYWGNERTYHHTAPINMNYALYEGLTLLVEEGLEACWMRHQENAELLWSGLESLGLKLVIPKEYRLPSLTTIFIPEDFDDLAVRNILLDKFNIEISGGLGTHRGKIWRIGLMGYSSQSQNVTKLLEALREILH
jgi:alanine-glyoxylate transaminase / serine-glyoxylate transaminase / serine-pyruvate transaminase